MDRVQELVSDKSGEMGLLVQSWVNIVLDDIASRGLLLSLKNEDRASLSAGQREYNLPDNTDHVFKVFVPAFGDPGGRLTKKNDDEFLELMFRDGFETQGRPVYYTIFSRLTLRLHPIPDTTNAPASPTTLQKLHIWRYRDIAHLDDDDDITEIKIKHIPTLIYGAYSLGAKFDSIADASEATAKYERGVARIVGDSYRDLDHPRQVAYRGL